MGVSTPLLIIHKPTGTTRISLEGQTTWTIGRGSENNIILNDHVVSRNHAEIEDRGLGEFVLTDVGSGNGSFVKGQRITESHRLQDGDRITMGRIQLEFQEGSEQGRLFTRPDSKTVLMLHTSALQGKVWQEVLASQSIAVAHLSASNDINSLLIQRAAYRNLPDLLLLDMTGIQANPYHFCRWCRDTYPQVKVILMSGKRTEISDSERKWAVHQGAVDLLPGFPEPHLFNNLTNVTAKVQLVLQALDVPQVDQQPLLEALLSIQTLQNQLPGSSANS